MKFYFFVALKKVFSGSPKHHGDLVFLSPAGLPWSSHGSDYSGVKVTVISVPR